MRFLLGGLVSVATLALAIGALTGRVKVRSCCAAWDPSRDLRMRGSTPPLATAGDYTPHTAGPHPRRTQEN